MLTGSGGAMNDEHQQAFSRLSPIWPRWLSLASAGIMAFGLIMVLLPALTMEGFSLLVYGSSSRIAGFGTEPGRYIALAHAVLGAVMLSWGLLLWFVVRGAFARGEREGWRMVALAVAAWFVPDTAFSLWSGFWHNALLNVLILLLYAVPLAATRSVFFNTR